MIKFVLLKNFSFLSINVPINYFVLISIWKALPSITVIITVTTSRDYWSSHIFFVCSFSSLHMLHEASAHKNPHHNTYFRTCFHGWLLNPFTKYIWGTIIMSYLNLSISKLMKPILGENTLSLFFLIVPRSFKYFVKIIRGWLGISVSHNKSPLSTS